jgi:hypothetical protein
MAKVFTPYETGKTVATVFFTKDDMWLVAGTGALQAYNGANLATYRVTGTEKGTLGLYVATVPTPLVLPAEFNWITQDTSTGAIVGVGTVTLNAAGVEETSTSLAQLVRDFQEADRYIDTAVSGQWKLVLIKKGTGGLGVGTELLRANLYDVLGSPITNTSTVLGRSISP